MDERSHISGFHSTRWSLVAKAASVDPEARRNALNDLFNIYRPALLCHLTRACRLESDAAEEILQGFIVEKVLERDLFATADPAKGKLRSLMLKSLQHYLVDRLRRNRRLVHVDNLQDWDRFMPARQ